MSLTLWPCRIETGPSMVEGMLENPELTTLLEHVTAHPAVAPLVGNDVWFANAHFVIRGFDPIEFFIKDIMACSMNQAKLVLAHFPHATVGAVVVGRPSTRGILARVEALSALARRPIALSWKDTQPKHAS